MIVSDRLSSVLPLEVWFPDDQIELPDNLLEMQSFSTTPVLLNYDLYFNKALRGFVCTLKFEKHFFHISLVLYIGPQAI